MNITLITKTQQKTIYEDLIITSINQIYQNITPNQSILINRTDLKDFLYPTKDFKLIKHYLRSNFIVHKLYFNPRTFEFFPINKCFLIHHK